MEPNVKAFMDVLGFTEGTDRVKDSDGGYKVVVGGSLFASYADHPRRKVYLPRYKVYSTAAGRYQMIAPTWDAIRKRLALSDFSPNSQDSACLELLNECGARKWIDLGDLDAAVIAASSLWASLPGSKAKQRIESMDAIREVYTKAGGTIA
jgi:muramidase (phage lysozyme)